MYYEIVLHADYIPIAAVDLFLIERSYSNSDEDVGLLLGGFLSLHVIIQISAAN